MTTKKIQLFLIYLFLVCSTCCGRFLRPSSGAHNCNCSFVYCQPILLRAGTMDEMELTKYQLAAILFDNSRSCNYSYVLLMMGEGIVRNMYSRLEINKSRLVSSCLSSFIIILLPAFFQSPENFYVKINQLI
jgi:hypothetical protein